MKLTPLDIRKQEFDRTMRGYNPDEVQAFLQMLSDQWQEQYDERRRLDEKVRDLQSKIQHYEQVEEALQEALQTARENKEKTLEHARREAELIVKEARTAADAIQQEAREEHERLKQEASQIGGRRSEIVARLRAFLMSEMELLARFEGEDPIGFIKLLPPERREQLREAAGGVGYTEEDVAAPAKEEAREEAPAAASRHQEAPAPQEKAPAPVPPEPAEEPATPIPPAAPLPEMPRSTWGEGDEARDLPGYLARFSSMEEAEGGGLRTEPPAVHKEQNEPWDAASAGVSPAERQANPGAGGDEQSGPGWIVHSLFSSGGRENSREEHVPHRREHPPTEAAPAANNDEDASGKASEEEMAKIRRILNDMD